MTQIMAVLLMLCAGALAVWLALVLAIAVIAGFFHQLGFAIDCGIIGIAIFFASWVFFPIAMLVLSLVCGLVISAGWPQKGLSR